MDRIDRKEGFQHMRNKRIVIIGALVAAAFLAGGCASLGLARQGNDFNYDAAAKLQKGMSMEQVTALLEGEPRATGRQMHTGYTHWHYEYAQKGGIGGSIPLVGASASKGKAYNCDVYFSESGKLVEFNYFTTQLGGQGASF